MVVQTGVCLLCGASGVLPTDMDVGAGGTFACTDCAKTELATMRIEYEEEGSTDSEGEEEYCFTKENGDICDNCNRSDARRLLPDGNGGKRCENCQLYYQRHGKQRPRELEDGRVHHHVGVASSAKELQTTHIIEVLVPVNGSDGDLDTAAGDVMQCWNCQTTASTGNRWTTLADGNILCRNCSRYRERNGGKDRPVELETAREEKRTGITKRHSSGNKTLEAKDHIQPQNNHLDVDTSFPFTTPACSSTSVINEFDTNIESPMQQVVARLEHDLKALDHLAISHGRENELLLDALEVEAHNVVAKLNMAKAYRDAEIQIQAFKLEDRLKDRLFKANYEGWMKKQGALAG